MALMGRVRLIEASPWYNGNEFYADWKRSDGTNFMPQVKDESKWGTAALLAKRLIKGSEAGSFKYKLHTVERKLDTKPLPENVPDENYPNGAGGIDAASCYAFMSMVKLRLIIMTSLFICAATLVQLATLRHGLLLLRAWVVVMG